MQAKWRECVLQKLAQADTGTPKHVSLYAGLVHAIESGRLKPGQKLPTETELADALPLSVGTIQRAMGSLVGDGLVLRRRLQITGSTLRPRPVAFKSAIAQSLRQHVWPLIAAGKIKPVIHSTFAAAQAADAHVLMESNQHVGKIVLTW